MPRRLTRLGACTLRGFLGLGLASLSACATPHIPQATTTHVAPEEEDQLRAGLGARSAYAHMLKASTRSAKIYQALDNKLFITATYHAPAFRRAFAVAFPDIYGHGGKITRRELVDLTGGIEQHHNFFVAVYTPDSRWNDIARDDSIWRLSLYGKSNGQNGLGETEVGPDDIIPIKMDENLRVVYPYTNRFDKVYLVRFPVLDAMHQPIVGPGTEELVVRIASAMGVASMRWRVARAPRQSSEVPFVPQEAAAAPTAAP